MFDADTSEFALYGDGRIDVFLRVDDPARKRARFRCIAMIKGDGDTASVIDFEPHLGRDTEALAVRARRQLSDPVLGHSFALNDMRQWPEAAQARDPIEVFLYHEFFRAWQVADLAGQRFQARLASHSGSAPLDTGQFTGAIASIFDYNRLDRGVAIARLLQPNLHARIQQPGFHDDTAGSTGYALRMLGDLCLRADDPILGLACFETALAAGENPFRRRKAIEAAAAAHDPSRLEHHLQAFEAQWPLPADLLALGVRGQV